MRNIACDLRGREIAKAKVEGLRVVQYGVLKDETVYVPDPGCSVEKISIADQSMVTTPAASEHLEEHRRA